MYVYINVKAHDTYFNFQSIHCMYQSHSYYPLQFVQCGRKEYDNENMIDWLKTHYNLYINLVPLIRFTQWLVWIVNACVVNRITQTHGTLLGVNYIYLKVISLVIMWCSWIWRRSSHWTEWKGNSIFLINLLSEQDGGHITDDNHFRKGRLKKNRKIFWYENIQT